MTTVVLHRHRRHLAAAAAAAAAATAAKHDAVQTEFACAVQQTLKERRPMQFGSVRCNYRLNPLPSALVE